MVVMDPLEGPQQLSGRHVAHKNSEHFGDVTVLVILARNAIFDASDLQFDRVGDPHKPQSLDYEVTDEELAEELAKSLVGASPRMVQRFETLWNEKVAQI